MEYQVPQFIEVEDRIFGPLTWKQFIFVAGGAGLCVTLILTLHVIGWILSIPVAIFALALAFYKLNGKSFLEVLEAAFGYFVGGRLYLWKKDPAPQVKKVISAPLPEHRTKLGLSESKLRDLAWSLDIKDVNAPQESQ